MNEILPSTIQAGVTMDNTVTLADYPAPDWTLAAHLRGPAVIDLEAAAATSAHRFAFGPDTTADWTAGVYSYVVRATRVSDGRVEQVESGQVQVLQDVQAINAPTDMRTHAQKTLDAIQAVLEKRATLDQDRYVINGRELWRTPVRDLLHLKTHYAALVRQERAKARGASLWRPAAQVRF